MPVLHRNRLLSRTRYPSTTPRNHLQHDRPNTRASRTDQQYRAFILSRPMKCIPKIRSDLRTASYLTEYETSKGSAEKIRTTPRGRASSGECVKCVNRSTSVTACPSLTKNYRTYDATHGNMWQKSRIRVTVEAERRDNTTIRILIAHTQRCR